jgi:hypothetical protein
VDASERIVISDLDADTRVVPEGRTPGRYVASIPEWWKAQFAFGGMTSTIALRAAEAAIGRPELVPVSATAAPCRAATSWSTPMSSARESPSCMARAWCGGWLRSDRCAHADNFRPAPRERPELRRRNVPGRRRASGRVRRAGPSDGRSRSPPCLRITSCAVQSARRPGRKADRPGNRGSPAGRATTSRRSWPTAASTR